MKATSDRLEITRNKTANAASVEIHNRSTPELAAAVRVFEMTTGRATTRSVGIYIRLRWQIPEGDR
jgi:hypothetical protein